MMSSEKTLPDLSLSLVTKEEESLSKEDECDHYKQRLDSLKIVLRGFQDQVALYKNRCLGVDTIVLALKESKQENIKLSKHVKALETAISILQKRLTQNGLSNSVNVQDTELFVPGASKQTLDNLAKETARLRSLLKQENSLGKNPSEKEDMKEMLEQVEMENNELKNKLKDMESIKLNLAKSYEDVIEKISKETEEERLRFDQDLKALSTKVNARDNRCYQNERNSVGTQAEISNEESFDELKDLLRRTVEKCSHLEGRLPRQASWHNQPVNKPEEAREEAVGMNYKWQQYNMEREKHIQALNDQIRELHDPHHMATMIEESTKQKTEELTYEINRRDAEIMELRKQLQLCSLEIENLRTWKGQIHQDNSTVEILKQQIQVCTEDFNTERKDREQAVQKARELQEEIEQLKAENGSLGNQVEHLKKMNEQQRPQFQPAASYETSLRSFSNAHSPPPQQPPPHHPHHPRYSSQFSQQSSSTSTPSPRLPPSFIPMQESMGHSIEHLGANHQPVVPFSETQGAMSMSTSSAMQGSVYLPPAHSDLMSASGGSGFLRQTVPPPSFSGTANSAANSTNFSTMPPLVKRGGSFKGELTCPRCNKTFSDEVLLSHINSCNKPL